MGSLIPLLKVFVFYSLQFLYLHNIPRTNGQALETGVGFTDGQVIFVKYEPNTGKFGYNLSGLGNRSNYEIKVTHKTNAGIIKKVHTIKFTENRTKDIGEVNLVIEPSYSIQNTPAIKISKDIILPEGIQMNLVSGLKPKQLKYSNKLFIEENLIESEKEITLQNGTKIKVTRDSDSNIAIVPIYWDKSVAGTVDSFTMVYKNREFDIGEYKVNIVTPSYFVAGNGLLDFGTIKKGDTDIKPKSNEVKIEYSNSDIKVDYTITNSLGEEINSVNLLKENSDNEANKLIVSDLKILGKDETGTERIVRLDGTIQSTDEAEVGEYKGEIELRVHIKN